MARAQPDVSIIKKKKKILSQYKHPPLIYHIFLLLAPTFIDYRIVLLLEPTINSITVFSHY